MRWSQCPRLPFLGGPKGALPSGAVDLADLHLVERKLARRLGQDRLHDDDALHAAGRALRTARRSIGQHGHAAPAHRRRLIQQRDDTSRSVGVAIGVVGAVVGDDEHVQRGDPAVLGKADLHPALEAGPRAADEMFFLAADAHHHRGIGLLRQQRRNDREDVARDLAAESAAGVFADEHDLVGIHIQPASEAGQGLHRALRPHVNVHLAVLPVSQRGARLEGLVAGVRRDKGFIQNQRRILEARVDIAVGPLVGRLAHGQAAFLQLGEVRLRSI